jgi:NAD(P)-dependent dehydrogenase (short-subunit alcohol dehydrogenase family)
VTEEERTICFTKGEMELFAEASGDLNPLHLQDQTVASGRFEAPVVYGVLGVLAALGALRARPGLALHAIDASFNRPLFAEHRYRLEVHEGDAFHACVMISDSGLRAFTVRMSFAGVADPPAHVGSQARRLREPLEPRIQELEGGLPATGSYGASHGSAKLLETRFCLPARGVGPYALHGLLCASYLVGMRLPGLGSLISRLQFVLVRAKPLYPKSEPRFIGPLTYRAAVVEFDADLGEATVSAALDHGARKVANFTCQTQARSPRAASNPRRIERHLQVSSRLQDHVAVVVGASRGLGGALALGLASQGCDVYACSRSGDGPRGVLSWSGSIEHSRGDGSDPEFCRDLLERIMLRRDRIDFLLCCAAPRLYSIGFGTYSMARFNDFVQRSIELVTVPMATFLTAVQMRAGGCLFVSSTALETQPREWGHYVTAKAAGEALAIWSTRCFPDVEMVVARVPRLGLGWRNSERIEEDALETEQAAAHLVDRLAERVGPGVHLVEW